jgi:hypothetical protein
MLRFGFCAGIGGEAVGLLRQADVSLAVKHNEEKIPLRLRRKLRKATM